MTDEIHAPKAFLVWEKSASVLRTEASHSVARAQRLLAIRYLRGRGVYKDEAISFSWIQLAAQQHSVMAQRSLGQLYEYGLGISTDITQASHWYRLAALQGDFITKEHLQRLAQSKTT